MQPSGARESISVSWRRDIDNETPFPRVVFAILGVFGLSPRRQTTFSRRATQIRPIAQIPAVSFLSPPLSLSLIVLQVYFSQSKLGFSRFLFPTLSLSRRAKFYQRCAILARVAAEKRV